MNSTLNYYDNMASAFTADTQAVDFHETQDYFLSYLTQDSYILDFGCGSGRDTRYYLEKGYRVDAVDGSAEMCRVAAEFSGIPVRQMLFSELAAIDFYDGIWACASILHLRRDELPDVLQKMTRALRDDGILYVTFKYGSFEGFRGDRYYTDMDESSFQQLAGTVPGLQIINTWISSDVRPGRSNEKWLNVILKKQ